MQHPLVSIAYYTLLEAIRNRLLWLVVVLLLAGLGLAEFIGAYAITESRQFQSGFLGALLRAATVFMISLFVLTSLVREFNDKGLELVLSLPITRATWFFAKLTGYSTLALAVAILCTLCLSLYVPPGDALLWGISLACELLLVTAFSVLCLFTFNQVTLGLSAVMAFYLLSRSMAAFRLIGQEPLLQDQSVSQMVINGVLQAIAYVLPDLDRFTASEWLIYGAGQWSDLLPILGQTAIYLSLIAAAGLFDLYRKNL